MIVRSWLSYCIVALLLIQCLSYVIVKTHDGNRELVFLIVSGWAKEVHHNDTIEYFGFKYDTLEHVSWNVISELKLGKSVPLLHRENASPDEAMRLELLKLTSLQVNLQYDLKYLGEFINPSVVKFKNRLLLCAGLAWGYTGLTYRKPNDMIEFIWANTSELPFYSKEPYLGIDPGVIGPLNVPIIGQDPRLIVINDEKVVLTYTNRMPSLVRMGMAEIEIDPVTNNATITTLWPLIHPPDEHNSHQKNWSPFIYNGTMLFIQRINPLHVVSLYNDTPYEMHSRTFSRVSHATIHWDYGEIRGGTNAVLIKGNSVHPDVYFALFHSSIMFKGNTMNTYFFGGYTFSTTPPFRLIAVSPYPMVDETMYVGEWCPIKPRHIDYVNFPMSLYEEAGVIHFSFGHQDHMAYIGKMNVESVLESLRPVTYHHDLNVTATHLRRRF